MYSGPVSSPKSIAAQTLHSMSGATPRSLVEPCSALKIALELMISKSSLGREVKRRIFFELRLSRC